MKSTQLNLFKKSFSGSVVTHQTAQATVLGLNSESFPNDPGALLDHCVIVKNITVVIRDV